MESGLESIVNDFSTAFESYRLTFSSSIKKQIRKLDDRDVLSTCTSPDTRFDSDETYFSSYINKNHPNILDFILDSNGNTATNNRLCAGLALAEVLIKSPVILSRSFMINGGTLYMINGGGRFDHDGHDLGAVPSCLYYTKYFQGVAHLLNQFISNLGSKFNKTLIQVGGDFNRSAQYAGGGSDHGGDGSNTTLITGIKPGGVILGEIDYTNNYQGKKHQGIWGQAKSNYSTEMVSNLVEYILGVPGSDRTFKDEDQLTRDYKNKAAL